MYKAISRKVVGKVHATIAKGIVGGFDPFTVFQRNLKEWHTKAMDICLRVGSTALVARNSVLIISHITFRDCRVHIFPTTFLEIAVNCKPGAYKRWFTVFTIFTENIIHLVYPPTFCIIIAFDFS